MFQGFAIANAIGKRIMPEDDKNEAKERVAMNDQKHSSHIKATAGEQEKIQHETMFRAYTLLQ